MTKLIKLLTHTRAVLHTVAIVASAVVSALAAVSLGGDPASGAMIGTLGNATVAFAAR